MARSPKAFQTCNSFHISALESKWTLTSTRLQLTLASLDTDTHAVPQSAILSIYTNFRGIGKNKVMDMLTAAVGGYPLTLDLKVDAREIKKKREDETQERFNERPFLYFNIDKDEKKVLDGMALGPYLEALSNGDKLGGAWNSTSKPLIIFIGNDPLQLKSLGEFSAHRIHYYEIESVGEQFINEQGYPDFPNYKLKVSKTMMGEIGKRAAEQVPQLQPRHS